MKWLFYIIVVVYIFYRTVFGVKVNEISGLSIYFKNSEGVFIEAGDSRAMTCTVPSNNHKVEWYKPNGQVVSRQKSSRVYAQYTLSTGSSTNLELNISRASVDDTGEWVCRSGDFENTFSVCVMDPTKFEGTLDEVAADEDRSYTLSCQAQGNPEPSISWYKDGELISEDNSDPPKYKMMKKFNNQDMEGLLTIASLSANDAGVYTCEATQESAQVNFCSSKEFFNITLNVNRAPMFEGLDAEGNIYGNENEMLSINCVANGYPPPKYHWFKKEGTGLNEFSDKEIIHHDNGSSILQLKVTEDSYDSQYICRATNELGEKEKVYTISEPEIHERIIQVMHIGFKTNGLVFNITWSEQISFHLHDIEVQYIATNLNKTTTSPIESDWKNIKKISPALGEIYEENAVVFISDLENNTEYWVRMRFKGDFGMSSWTDAVKAKTAEKIEVDELISNKTEYEKGDDVEENEKTTDDLVICCAENYVASMTEKEPGPQAADGSGDVHGLFFVVGVLAVAIGSTFLTRLA